MVYRKVGQEGEMTTDHLDLAAGEEADSVEYFSILIGTEYLGQSAFDTLHEK